MRENDKYDAGQAPFLLGSARAVARFGGFP